MNNLEEYQNQIELLKQALLFYAEEKNYKDEVQYERTSLIDVDNGTQARFALDKLKETIKLNQKMEEEYLNNISEKIINSGTPESVIKLIEEIKKVGEDENI